MTIRERLSPFFVTLSGIVVVCAIKKLLFAWFGIQAHYLLFYSAIVISAWYGGSLQGILATVLSILAIDWYFINPGQMFDFSRTDIFSCAIFAFDALLVTFLCSKLRKSSQRAEQALTLAKSAMTFSKANELRFRKVAESNLIGLMEITRDGYIVAANDYVLKILGRERVEIEAGQLRWQNITPPELADASEAAVRKIYEDGTLLPFEKEYFRQDGTRIPILVGASRVSDNRHVSYLLDLTQIKKARSAIAQHQRLSLLQAQTARVEAEKTAERLRFLAEASVALNETLDLRPMLDAFAKVVVSHMADWCEVVLMAEGELKVGEVVIAHRDPNTVHWKEDFTKRNSIDFDQEVGVGHAIRTGRPQLHSIVDDEFLDNYIQNTEKRQFYKDLGMNSAIIAPLQYYGRVIGAIAICSLKGRSNRHYDDLDLAMLQDLAKRSALAIENGRLFRRAQEASEAKSAFLANMSHEIRTPLGAMLGFAELLSDEQLTPEQRRYLDTLNRNGQQLLRIVDEVLDLSKVESNRLRIENIAFSLPGLIDEITSLLMPQAEAKNLHLEIHRAKDLPMEITSDPTRLRQILINVIGNAIKFTPKGNVHVTFEVHWRTAHPNHPILEVSVADTGIGITKEQRDHLFQPFVQADNSMTRKFGGTGLGLFLSRKLARLMGGDVVLGTSQISKGSRFIVTLEIETDESACAWPAPAERSSEESAHDKVLVVDDAEDNRNLIQLYLERLGYEADVADSGRQAVEIATRKNYGLILMDVQMPEMDGFEAVKELRKRGYPNPIVALTAHTMKGDRERCLEGGFDDYLGKPLDRELLRQCLHKYIQPAHVPSPSTSSSLI